MTYLDNAATTFPKADTVLEAMVSTYRKIGVSPGRGSYDLAIEAEDLVQTVRRKVAAFFGGTDPNRVIFTSNATDALNIAIQGIAGRGDHVVSTHLEHNSVLRPLHHLCRKGLLEYDLVPFDGNGYISPDDIAVLFRANTRLVVVCHAANVLGTIQPIAEIGRICAERGVPLLVDAAQSAGLALYDRVDLYCAQDLTNHIGLMTITVKGIDPQDVGAILDADFDIQVRAGLHCAPLVHQHMGTLDMAGTVRLSPGHSTTSHDIEVTIKAVQTIATHNRMGNA